MEEPNADVLARGATIGRYVVVDVIGRGGMGVVYSAFDSVLDRKLAIKVLRSDLLTGERASEIEERLLREAQALARLTHPNVVAIHDVGTFERRIFLAMEFVEGPSLKEWLLTGPSQKERLRVLRDAGRGLAAAHAAGLVHRDFKPDNIIVSREGRVVVLDFGLARVQGDDTPEAPLPELPPPSRDTPTRDGAADEATGEGAEAPEGRPPLTMTGHVLGTVGYMAPEQLFGEATSGATDQFSFAATLYFALYGERAFPDRDLASYVESVHEPVPAPSARANEVPAWLRRVVLRGLSPEAKDRFPSMDAMLAALETDPGVPRRRALAVAAAILALGVGVAAATQVARQRALVCAPDPSELAGAWDPGVRAAITQAFERSGVRDARASADRVNGKLDEFAGRWLEMRAQACRATRVDKQQPEDVLRLRDDCLDRERTQLRSLTATLANADADVVKSAVDFAYGLPQTSWCADVTTLRASAGLPDDPARRAKALAVRAILADAEASTLAGRLTEAEARTADAVTRARDLGDAPTTAEALYYAGQTRRAEGDFEASLPLLREAAFLAAGAGADSIVVRAAESLAFVTGPKLQRGGEPRLWLDLARAALTRMGGNEELARELLVQEAGQLSEVEWRPDLAIPIERKLVAECKRVYGVHPKTELALYNIGVEYTYLGQPDRARPYLEEARAMDEALGGPQYASVGQSEYMLGWTYAMVGERQAADDRLRAAIVIFEQNGMAYWSALAYQALTTSALAAGDTAAAVQSADAARAQLAAAKSPSVLLPIVDVTAAQAYLRAGRPRDAQPLCEASLAEQEKSGAIAPEKAYGWDALRCEAEVLSALGRSADAVPLLERSLTLEKRMAPGDYARAELALARALVAAPTRTPTATHAGRARAAQLAAHARQELAKWPGLAWELGQLDAWVKSALLR